MTTAERQGDEPSLSAYIPNLDAQRAYAASIAPPPRPRRPQRMMRRARLAGGVGGAMMLLGIGVAGFGASLSLLPLLLESLVRWFDSLLVGVEASAESAIIDVLQAGPWPWIGVSLLVIGLAAFVVGAFVSVRTLRTAGFARPVRFTAAAFGIAVGARIALGIFTVPFSSLLSPLVERALVGFASGGIEQVGTTIVIVITCIMNVAISAATSMVAWWLLAHATRPAAAPRAPGPPSR